MANLRLTYSVADQNFKKTKSVGILNTSMQLLTALIGHPSLSKMDILSNSTLNICIKPSATKTEVHLHDMAIAGSFRRILWDQFLVYRAAKKLENSWLLLPKGFASFLGPCPVRLGILSHDAMIDYYEQHFPAFLSRFESLYFKRCLQASFRYAKIMLCTSKFTLSEMERLARKWNCRKPDVVAIGLGVMPKMKSLENPRSELVVLVSAHPHKRTDLAVNYLDRWQQETRSKAIVHWVGRFPKKLSLPKYSNWQFHERIEETIYRRLMATARILIYFTDYEGYGLPPIEAVMSGACPVYSDIPVTREVMLGLGCAFQNSSYDSFSQAMKRANEVTSVDLDDWAIHLGQIHSWTTVAQRLVDVLTAFDTDSSK